MLAAIGVNVAVQHPNGQIYYITDLNRRPVDKDSMKKARCQISRKRSAGPMPSPTRCKR